MATGMVVAKSSSVLVVCRQCWHVSPRRGETERQKYFLPGRQKYLSALVSPLWAETSQLFTYIPHYLMLLTVDLVLSSLCISYQLAIQWE